MAQKKEKNLCGKRRELANPYEVWRGTGIFEGWEWRVLKKYQTPNKEKENPYARWLCAVRSPSTQGGWDMGDVYIKDVVNHAVKDEDPAKITPLGERECLN